MFGCLVVIYTRARTVYSTPSNNSLGDYSASQICSWGRGAESASAVREEFAWRSVRGPPPNRSSTGRTTSLSARCERALIIIALANRFIDLCLPYSLCRRAEGGRAGTSERDNTGHEPNPSDGHPAAWLISRCVPDASRLRRRRRGRRRGARKPM